MRADPACQKRLEELARRASGTGRPQLAGFLSPAEQAQAELCARRAGVALFLEGGTPDAERRVAAFADADWTPTWPIAALQIAWNARQGSPGHRDLLGSLLALGVDRSVLGDIFPGEGEARAYVLERVAAYLAENLTRVGGTAVSARICEEALAPPAAAAGEARRRTVASLRLDAVLGAAWDLSRGKAAELVASGRVQVDYLPELRPDRHLHKGAVLSVRGLGRAKIAEIGGKTKKDRVSVMLLRF